MRHVQIPGVDAIWNQIWMDKIADFPKLASSAAHLNGEPRSMSESFAAYRIRPNVKQGKWVIDHQFARGINLFEIMFFGSSAEGAGQPSGWMASDSFPSLMEYTNRLSWVLSQGRPTAKIALYMPTESMWFGDDEANISTWNIARDLLEHQRDFDFVDNCSLAEGLILENGKLINQSGQAYQAVIIPGSSIISRPVLERLEKFSVSGGNVMLMGHEPGYIMDSVFMDVKIFEMPPWIIKETSGEFTSRINEALPSQDILIEPASPAVKYVHRHLKNAELYFLFNESEQEVSGKVMLEGSGSLSLLNPLTGESEQHNYIIQKGQGISMELKLDPYESRIYLLDSP